MTTVIRAFMTGTRVTFDESGETITEENGWVDYDFSSTVLYDSRNDVRPVATFNSYVDEETPDEFIQATVDSYLGAAYDNGDGTFYGSDDVLNRDALENGAVWQYALHFEQFVGLTERGTASRWDSIGLGQVK